MTDQQPTEAETPDQIATRFAQGDATNEEYRLMDATEIEAPFSTYYGAPRIVSIYGHWFLSVEPQAGYPNMLSVSEEFAAAWTAEFAGESIDAE